MKLGNELYNEMLRLVREISHIKKTSVLWAAVCYPKSENQSKKASDSISRPIANIYFGTNLLQAYRKLQFIKTSLDLKKVLINYDWERLVREAQANLQAFRNFEESCVNKVTLIGCCFGGICIKNNVVAHSRDQRSA